MRKGTSDNRAFSLRYAQKRFFPFRSFSSQGKRASQENGKAIFITQNTGSPISALVASGLVHSCQMGPIRKDILWWEWFGQDFKKGFWCLRQRQKWARKLEKENEFSSKVRKEKTLEKDGKKLGITRLVLFFAFTVSNYFSYFAFYRFSLIWLLFSSNHGKLTDKLLRKRARVMAQNMQ